MHNINVWYRCRSVALLPLKISISLAWALITFIRRLWSVLVILLCRSTNQSFHHFHLFHLFVVFDVILQTPQGTIKAILVNDPSTTIQQKDSIVMVCSRFPLQSFLFYFFSLYQFLAGWQIGSFPVIRWRWLCNLSWKCTKGPNSFKKQDLLLDSSLFTRWCLVRIQHEKLEAGMCVADFPAVFF